MSEEAKVSATKTNNEYNIKLSYFPFGGRAACIRLLLYINNIKYEDELIDFKTFGQMRYKGLLIYGGLPEATLKIDNKVYKLSQSNAILRYFGKKTKLYPINNDIECALIDGILDACEDGINLIMPSILESDPNKRSKMRKALFNPDNGTKALPYFFKKFETRFIENEQRGNKNGFVVGNSLSIADLKLWTFIATFPSIVYILFIYYVVVIYACIFIDYKGLFRTFDGFPDNFLAKYDKLAAFYDKIGKMDTVITYANVWNTNIQLFAAKKKTSFKIN